MTGHTHFIDRSFAISLSTFGVGALTGFLLAVLVPVFREAIIGMLWIRVLAPVEGALRAGGFMVVIVIFTNNAIPILLSFLYPILLARIHWTPPLTRSRSNLLLTGYSVLAAYLLGFFDLGATLGAILSVRGTSVLNLLLYHSWLHGPIEFMLILLCVAEPARIAAREGTGSEIAPYDSKDAILLFVCLVGLLLSAILEFALGI